MQFSIKILERFGIFTIPIVMGIIAVLMWGLLELSYSFFNAVYLPDFLIKQQTITIYDNEAYSAFSLIMGMGFMSVIGLLLASLIGIGTAVSFSEFFDITAHPSIKKGIQLIAAIPSIVYGFLILWGLVPFMELLFPIHAYSNAILGGIVLGLMMSPLICSKVFETMEQVSDTLREGAYALGATKYQTAFRLIIPAYFVDILIGVLRTYARTISEILIVALIAGMIQERTKIIITIFLTIFLIVGYTFYLKRYAAIQSNDFI